MKELWKKFISNKLNIALCVIQFVALLFLALVKAWMGFMYFFVISEGTFFLIWGIKTLIESKKILKMLEQYSDLPLTSDQKLYYTKSGMSNYKNARFRGVMMIIIGVVIWGLVFSL